MRLRLDRLLAVIALAVMAVGAASSYSTRQAGDDGTQPAGLAAPQDLAAVGRGAVVQSIVQLDHGRHAHFATCTLPACPAVTPKTPAVDPAAATATAMVPHVDAGSASSPAEASSPRPGKSSVVAAAQAPGTPTDRPEIGPVATTAPLVTEVVVTFAFGSAALTAAARAAIDAAVSDDGIRRIDIRGRTDNVGPASVNDELARRRAAAVAQHLRVRHPQLVNAEVLVDARGRCCYAADNDTPAGRVRNRRVEIAFARDPSDL